MEGSKVARFEQPMMRPCLPADFVTQMTKESNVFLTFKLIDSKFSSLKFNVMY